MDSIHTNYQKKNLIYTSQLIEREKLKHGKSAFQEKLNKNYKVKHKTFLQVRSHR